MNSPINYLFIPILFFSVACKKADDSSNKNFSDNATIMVEVYEKPSISISKDAPFQISSQKTESCVGNFDSINNQIVDKPFVELMTIQARFTGWFGDRVQGTSPIHAAIYFKRKSEIYYAKIPLDYLRPDVAKMFKENNLVNYGFDALINIATLPPGKFEIGLLGQFDNFLGNFVSGIFIEKKSPFNENG